MTLVLDYFSKLNRFVANLHVWTSDLVVSTCSLVHLYSEPAEKGLVPLYNIYMPGYVPLWRVFGFQAVYARIGYRNERVLVKNKTVEPWYNESYIHLYNEDTGIHKPFSPAQ